MPAGLNPPDIDLEDDDAELLDAITGDASVRELLGRVIQLLEDIRSNQDKALAQDAARLEKPMQPYPWQTNQPPWRAEPRRYPVASGGNAPTITYGGPNAT